MARARGELGGTTYEDDLFPARRCSQPEPGDDATQCDTATERPQASDAIISQTTRANQGDGVRRGWPRMVVYVVKVAKSSAFGPEPSGAGDKAQERGSGCGAE